MKIFLIFILSTLFITNVFGQEDRILIERACLNYIEGFYEGDTVKLKKSLSPQLHKFGFYKSDNSVLVSAGFMTYNDALNYANNVKKNGEVRSDGDTKEVEILDFSSKTASAKVRAWWGIDYIHLVKEQDSWLIEQVLWQSDDNEIEVASFYHQIPDYPEYYSAKNLLIRMIDGMGFRYHWATDGLTNENLKFAPGEDSRSIKETLIHIHGLVEVINSSIKGQPIERPRKIPIPDSWEDLRLETLHMIIDSREYLAKSDNPIFEEMNMVFKRGENENSFPLWNVINGPLSDAIWHIGQVVAYRRLAGNPFNNKVNVLKGVKRD